MKSAGKKLNLQTFFQHARNHLLQESTMKNILFVLSSPRGWKSYSHQFAGHIVDDLKARHPDAKVVVRDVAKEPLPHVGEGSLDRKSTRLNSSHRTISYAGFCLKKKTHQHWSAAAPVVTHAYRSA